MNKSRVNLSDSEKQKYLTEHLPYRLNSLRAYDVYIKRRKASNYKKELPSLKCYWESEFLEPAFEVSIVFGRSLLNFLGIMRGNNGLQNFEAHEIKDSDKDTVFIWHINDKGYYPINKLDIESQNHLLNLIKIANKSVAHLTTKNSTEQEQNSLLPAREIIYNIMLEHVEGLDTTNLWWTRG